LSPGETILLDAPHGGRLQLTATPARHGPAHGDRGPVIGFLLRWNDELEDALYISGDTVWYEGVEQVRNHGPVRAVIAFAGAAKVQVAGDDPLTLTAEDAVRLARAFEPAVIVPVHYEGWEHFSEGRSELERAFAAAKLSSRLLWLEPGKPTPLPS
jgi:L-ascorbate metabolism protein UlaG (beta-lactamase superfamily)